MTTNPYDATSDPAKRHSAALTDGPDRAPARAMLKGDRASPTRTSRGRSSASRRRGSRRCRATSTSASWRSDVKAGIRAAGGTPMEFNTISVSDGVSMGTEGMRASLVSREVIADSIELVARGHLFDGLVCLVGCDKTIPAAVMALARLDIPGLVLYNGSIAPGPLPRPRRDDPGRLRGRRRPRGREDERRGAARARERRLPRRRRLRRPVHRQHDVDGARVPRDQPGRAERHPGARPGEGRRRPRRPGALVDGPRAPRRAPVADRSRARRSRTPIAVGRRHAAARRTASCTCSRSPASSASRSTIDDFDAHRRAHAGRRRPQARRALRRDRPLRGRRRRASSRASSSKRELVHAGAPNVDGRTLGEIADGVAGDARARRSSSRSRRRSSRRAASRSCAATSRPRAAW